MVEPYVMSVAESVRDKRKRRRGTEKRLLNNGIDTTNQF